MDEPIDEAASRAAPSPPPRRQVTIRRSGPMPGLRDAPSRRATPEARTTRARKPPRRVLNEREHLALGIELVQQLRRPPRPIWRDITNASTAWRHKLSDDLRHFRAWGMRRRGLTRSGRLGCHDRRALARSRLSGRAHLSTRRQPRRLLHGHTSRRGPSRIREPGSGGATESTAPPPPRVCDTRDWPAEERVRSMVAAMSQPAPHNSANAEVLKDPVHCLRASLLLRREPRRR